MAAFISEIEDDVIPSVEEVKNAVRQRPAYQTAVAEIKKALSPGSSGGLESIELITFGKRVIMDDCREDIRYIEEGIEMDNLSQRVLKEDLIEKGFGIFQKKEKNPRLSWADQIWFQIRIASDIESTTCKE